MSAPKYRDFVPGCTVKLTGNFLISTGQRKGGEGTKRWTVLLCTCALCRNSRHVAVNEPTTSIFSDEEIAKEPGIVNRHIAKENLSIVGQIDPRNCGDVYVGQTMEGLIKGRKALGDARPGSDPVLVPARSSVSRGTIKTDLDMFD